ncbi:hypothetical protein EST38_g11707 [Candolleomyces aberdarensis]|uniref:NACHT domain-containing protein n=1 Tax=Candolleomyces aberdarensis TaxID=2316362 RepID=A0A4V1Q279_9AGAR|nr:hypothetical protein EST38_g11707 [Candolleomyces aberdarensis]
MLPRSPVHTFGSSINGVGPPRLQLLPGASDFSMRDPRFNIASGDINIYQSKERDIADASAQKVARWLSATDVKRIHADTLAKRTPGTGIWLVEGDQFTLWSRGERKVLWVTGMPGSGKTILAYVYSIIAGTLADRCQYKVPASPAEILSTFLRQLFEEDHEGVSAIIEPIYLEWLSKSNPLSEEQTIDILGKVFGLFQKVYIVVDALDELKENTRNRLLRLLASLPKGNLFLTSRPMNPESNVLAQLLNREVDYLQIADKNRGDIATFVSTTLKNNLRLSSIAPTESATENILTKMNQKSSGMFLLASLQVESLKHCISTNDLLDKIERLPSGVTEMYERTMERIEAQESAEASLARRALLWVTYAQTYLTLKRLQRALAISPQNGFSTNDISPEYLILSCCCGLLVVDPSTRFVRLVHFTADDFIRSLSGKIFKSPHTFIAQHCIAYLSSPAPTSPSSPIPSPLSSASSSQSFALEPRPISVGDDDTDWKCQDGREIAFPYAYGDWGVHAKQAWAEPDSGIASIVAAFVMGCKDYICNISSASGWQSALRPTTEIIQPAHLVALHGLSKILPSMKVSWRQRTSSGSTPLHLAAYKGHEDIAQTIFEEAPTWVNDVDDFGYTPFMLACQQGHVDIVNIFLSSSHSINLNARTTPHNSTPLILATIWGHAPVVELLVHRRAEDGERIDVDLHAQDNQGQTALMIACALGFQEIVEILTRRGDLNVNQSTAFRYTAFTEAAIHGSIPIFKLLLEHPLQAFNPMEDTALIRASRFGREAMVEYLLSLKNIDPNVRCGAGNTPLITAAADGHQRICSLLLKHPDMDVNAQNGTTVAVRHRDISPRMNRTGTGTTALMMACMGGHRSVVALLLDHEDINVDVKDHTGKTALLLVRREGRHGKDIVTSLLQAMSRKLPGKMRKHRSSNGAVGSVGF